MSHILVSDALNAEAAQSDITVRGWVRTRRDNKGFSFLELNDGSCLKNIQVIIDEGVPAYAQIKDIGVGASVSVDGDLVESPGKGQKWEVKARDMKIYGLADQESFPLQKKRHSDEFLRGIAHLRPRTNKFGAIFRIRSEAAYAVHKYFRDRGFYYVHSPIITGSDCEGAGDLFRVTSHDLKEDLPKDISGEDFFGKDSYLTVSGQLSAEVYATSLGRVYTFGPTFRAENSNTARHAAEFWMIEPEVAFYDLEDNMDLAEDFLKTLIRHIRENCAEDLELFTKWVDKTLNDTLDNILENDFVRLPYTEAIEILQNAKKAKFEYKAIWGDDLQTEHERYLTEKHFKRPVIVYNYPKSLKPFYMYVNDDDNTVGAMDVLIPRVGEIIGGSQREDRYDVLEARMQEQGLDREHYEWYLDLRKYGSVPHSGFGMGFERFLMMVTGVANIRDVIPFPRTPNSLEF